MQAAPSAEPQDTAKAQAVLQDMQASQPALADVSPEQLGSVTAEDLGSDPEQAEQEAVKLELTQSVAAAAGFADKVRAIMPLLMTESIPCTTLTNHAASRMSHALAY